MLRLSDDTLVLAASDLTDYLACGHLAQQRLAIACGERGRPRPADDPHAELIRRRGDEHEREHLEHLSREYGAHVDLSGSVAYTLEALEASAEATEKAMRAGAPLIFQAQFFDGRWQGMVDFLRRTPAPSELGDFSYEILDTKLARHVKPAVVHQLSVYNRLLAQIQGLEPGRAHVVLGDGTTVEIDLHRYAALHRHLVRRLERVVSEPAERTYPEPVAHCGICTFESECRARRIADDHLSLVAYARREHRRRLEEEDIATMTTLANTSTLPHASSLNADRYATLHSQAALQVDSRVSGEPAPPASRTHARRRVRAPPAGQSGGCVLRPRG